MKPVMEAGKVSCIPVAMPYIDSLFMARAGGDRPDVLPKGGEFAEAPTDCVFTVPAKKRVGFFQCVSA